MTDMRGFIPKEGKEVDFDKTDSFVFDGSVAGAFEDDEYGYIMIEYPKYKFLPRKLSLMLGLTETRVWPVKAETTGDMTRLEVRDE